jgi:hypothetical protein
MQSYHNNNNADLAQEEEAASGANRVQKGTGRKLPGLPKGTTGCPCGRDVVVSSSVSPSLPLLLLPLQMRHSSSYTNQNIAAKTKQKILRRGGDLCLSRKKKERIWTTYVICESFSSEEKTMMQEEEENSQSGLLVIIISCACKEEFP